MENKNENLYTLATRVLNEYNIKPDDIKVIQGNNIKTVWKLKVGSNLLCLKRLKHTYDKALFSVTAQDYVRKNSGNVPEIIRDKNNNMIVAIDDQLFVLYEWLYGRDLAFNNKDDLKEAILGLSKFHLSSKGYIPPLDSRTSTKLGKWPDQYDSMKNKIISWKEIAAKNSSISSYSSYLKYCDSMVEISNKALDLLNASSYKQLTSADSNSVVLCHQDYGKGNAILTNEGVYVIDLDGVTFDHPARDLRKIIGKLSENRGYWYKNLISDVLNWYISINPLNEYDKKILYIDLLYPHWFYGLVKNIFKNNKLESSSKIEKISKLELSKISTLESLM
ncbi:UNVERIFIED_CONTAM: spore coat protein I [Acetivibrio alkalicellulosi]